MAFPKDFVWGAATSSYQIEGAALEDGRGECIWTRFSHTPGKVHANHNGDVACDHYHRYAEDIQIMKNIGLRGYRFSVSWPRILPQGIGEINPLGLDFYDRLVDALLENHITPYLTLYHWDLPQALQDRGGWTNSAIVEWFTNYAQIMAKRLGDRVKYWATHNESEVIAFLGHVTGEHAPGIQDENTGFKAIHQLLLSHGAAVSVIRQYVPDAKVGIVTAQAHRSPASDSPEDRAACELVVTASRHWYLDPLFKGCYPTEVIDVLGERLAGINLDEVSKAQQPLDFLGVNYYFRHIIRATDNLNAPFEVIPPEGPITAMGWEIYPQGMTQVLLDLNERYQPQSVYIMENGAAFDDLAPDNGVVEDPQRVDYLKQHIDAVEQAIVSGVPVKGYFVWSLLDNFEWAHGYDKRFGIVRVDFSTQARTLKRSALFYRDWITSQSS